MVLDLRMTQWQLNSAKDPGSAADRHRFSSAQRVCAELRWVDTDTGHPRPYEPGVLASG